MMRLLRSRCSLAMTAMIIMTFFPACHPTYKKETFKESVKELAKKEYDLDVDVAEAGKTLGLRFRVANLLSEMYSGDDDIYKKMNGLFTILARVALSSDASPDFIVLDILDESNANFRLVFTRYMEDVRKSMAEALSYSQSQDRLLQEFIINGKRVSFDPSEMDLIRIMMMAVDSAPSEGRKPATAFILEDVSFTDFLSRVIENTTRRLFREKKNVNEELQIRDVSAKFVQPKGKENRFKVFLDLVSKPKAKLPPQFLEGNVLPLVAKEAGNVFRSYRFHGFADITVVEKNSGKALTVPAR